MTPSSTSTLLVPTFGIAQIDGVREYLMQVWPCFTARVGICGYESNRLLEVTLDAMDACAADMATDLNCGFVSAKPASRLLLDHIAPVIINPDSRLIGCEHLEQCLEHQRRGGNFVLVSNHTSGADTIALDYLVNRAYNGACRDWIGVAGHVVNLYLIPLLACAGFNRAQIFSVKYKSQAAGADAMAMARQNVMAMRALADKVSGGGKCVWFYPEGGRGEGALIRGVAATMKIVEIVNAMRCEDNLLVIPSYVQGATSVLPVHRGDNEFNEMFEHVQRGTVSISFGQPISWSELQPCAGDLSNFESPDPEATEGGRLIKAWQIDKVMRGIAALCTTDAAKGPYT